MPDFFNRVDRFQSVANDNNAQLADHGYKRTGRIERKRLVKCNSIERSVPMQSGGQVVKWSAISHMALRILMTGHFSCLTRHSNQQHVCPCVCLESYKQTKPNDY